MPKGKKIGLKPLVIKLSVAIILLLTHTENPCSKLVRMSNPQKVELVSKSKRGIALFLENRIFMRGLVYSHVYLFILKQVLCATLKIRGIC